MGALGLHQRRRRARLLQFLHQTNGYAGYNTNQNMTLVSYFMCAETDEEARRRAEGMFFQFTLKHYSAGRLGKNRDRPPPGTFELCAEYEKWKTEESGRSRAGYLGRSAWLAVDDPQPLARVFDIACRPNHPV